MNAASEDLDVNDNEVDNTIGLRLTRAETDLTCELKRLNKENRPVTPGVRLRRTRKTLNFPSKINFNELGLGDGSSIDLNGNFKKTLFRKVIPMKPPLPTGPFTFQGSRESSFTVFTAPTFISQRSQFDSSSKQDSRGGGTIPSEPHWGTKTVSSYNVTISDTDKSKGDGSGRSFPPRKIQDNTGKGDVSYPVTNLNSTVPEVKTAGETSIPGVSVVVPSSSKGAIAHTNETEPQPSGLDSVTQPAGLGSETQPSGLDSVTQPAGLGSETQPSGLDSSDVPTSTSPSKITQPELSGDEENRVPKSSNNAVAKIPDEKSNEISNSTSPITSSKASNTLASKSGKSAETSNGSSKTESSSKSVEVDADTAEKRGAIIFKVPGGLTHKTTIKVSHFPGNGNPCLFPEVSTVSNQNSNPMEVVVEDIVPTPQMPNCSYSPQSQMQHHQQMLAYQQYCCGGQRMYCNPYCYPSSYPYGRY